MVLNRIEKPVVNGSNMKIAKLLAGIVLMGCVSSLSAADNPPVPFIIGGEEVIEPSAVESTDPLVLPDEPGLPALDEPIAISEEGDMLDFGDLETSLSIDEPTLMLEELGEPIVFDDISPEEELAAEADLEAAQMPFLLEDPVEDLSNANDLGLPALDFAAEVTSDEEPMVLSLEPVSLVAEEVPAAESVLLPDAMASENFEDIMIPEEPVEISGDLDDGLDGLVVIDPSIDLPKVVMGTREPVEAPIGMNHLSGDKEEWGNTYEARVPPARVVGPDGSEHIEGLEHIVGRSSPLLQEVKGIRRTIAEVGQPSFPTLNVKDFALTDLLAYLRNFTGKRLQSTLPDPMYVTMDIAPKNIDEVFEYLKANYPIDLVKSPESIMVVPAEIMAMDSTGRPIMPGDTLDNIMVKKRMSGAGLDSSIAWEDAPSINESSLASSKLSVGALPKLGENLDEEEVLLNDSYQTAQGRGVAMADSTGMMIDEQMWYDMQRNARLTELQQQRNRLLEQRSGLERKIRNYNLNRRKD